MPNISPQNRTRRSSPFNENLCFFSLFHNLLQQRACVLLTCIIYRIFQHVVFMYDDFLLFALQYYLHMIHNISVATRSG